MELNEFELSRFKSKPPIQSKSFRKDLNQWLKFEPAVDSSMTPQIASQFIKFGSRNFTIASPSCSWRNQEEQFMSTYGKVFNCKLE